MGLPYFDLLRSGSVRGVYVPNGSISHEGSLYANNRDSTTPFIRFIFKEIFSVEGHYWCLADCSEDEIASLKAKLVFLRT